MDNAEALRALDKVIDKLHKCGIDDEYDMAVELRNHLTDHGYVRVPVERLRKLTGLVGIVEGASGAICHGTWRDGRGCRLKDTAEWASYFCATKETSHD